MNDTVVIEESPTQVIVNEDQVTVVVPNDAVQIITVAEQGPAGPQGVSGDANYTQSFTSTSSVTVVHGLGKYPAVTVLDSAWDECEGMVDHISVNQLVVSFSAPFSGIIVCN